MVALLISLLSGLVRVAAAVTVTIIKLLARAIGWSARRFYDAWSSRDRSERVMLLASIAASLLVLWVTLRFGPRGLAVLGVLVGGGLMVLLAAARGDENGRAAHVVAGLQDLVMPGSRDDGADLDTEDPAQWAATIEHVKPLVLPRGVAEQPGRLTLGTTKLSHGPGTVTRSLALPTDTHLSVFGSTGSSKTVGLLTPALLGDWPGNILAVSVKPDVLLMTQEWRQRRAQELGGTVTVFDPTGSVAQLHPSVSWSPLTAAQTWEGAQRVAAAMVAASRSLDKGDTASFFADTARDALAPMLLAAAWQWDGGGQGVSQLMAWVARKQDAQGEVAAILNGDNPAGLVEEAALDAWEAVFSDEDRTLSNIFTTIRSALIAYRNPGVLASADSPTVAAHFDPRTFASGVGNTHYLATTQRDQQTLAPAFVAHIGEVVEAAYDVATENSGRLPVPLLLLIDEAAQTAPMPNLAQLLATARSYGISVVTVWQDFSQLCSTYGDHTAASVVNNSTVAVLAGEKDPSTLRLVSDLLGETDVERTSISDGGETVSQQRTSLAPAQVVRQQRSGSAIVVHGNLPAVRGLRLRLWFDDAMLAERGTPLPQHR